MKPAKLPERNNPGLAVFLACLGLAFCLAACRPSPALGGEAAPSPTPAEPTPSLVPTATAAPSATPDPTVTPEPAARPSLSSPLATISLQELEEILTTPFQRPAPGLDDGHHGADFSFYTLGERHDILGLSVLSVLDGRVAARVDDRPPYGNMVIIETALDQLPPEWPEAWDLDPAGDLPAQPPRLQCPRLDAPAPAGPEERSVYLLYAHLQSPAGLSLGEEVRSGQEIGAVGNTGMSGNPHLHLEVRVGPSFATFPEMAHYDNGATTAEMANYCAWRISGTFRMVDPLIFLHQAARADEP